MEKLREILESNGFEIKVMPDSTRTAQEAAEAIGCGIAEIVKSIIFRSENGDAVLVTASGVNRIDEKLVEELIGQKIYKADADFVKEKTGYVIGGVPPFGHREKLITIIDEDLRKFEYVWAAAGDQHSVFGLKPEELVRISGGKVAKIC